MPPSDDVPDSSAFSLRRIALPAFGPTLMFGIGEGAILPMIPLMARDLGASIPLAALMVTLLGLGSLLNNLPASYITMRWGERGAIIAAGFWSAAGMLLCLMTHRLELFALGCFMVGMSQSVYNIARQSYLSAAVPVGFRARALSTLGGVMRIGLFVGPFLAATVVHAFGMAAAFWVGIAGVVCASLIGMRVPDLPEPALPAGQAPVNTSWLGILKEHRRVFLTLGLAVLLVSAVRASRQAVLPLWADHLLLAPAAASLIYGLAGGIEMLLFYPAGKVMDTKGRRWVALPSMLIMGTALALVPFTTGFVSLLIVAMAIGFANGIGSGLIMTLGADHAPRHGRAYFLGAWRLMADIGSTAGPALVALLAAAVSLPLGVGATGAIAFTAAALMARWIPAPPAR
ncbi:MFS transporter [Comamonas endophytica]|uniref:MFS transporter n=1 Tax=Comamonas endophytica TaxID=2949090 RepID=A0ABY6GD83_9BURK|nr:MULTISPECIES: MFS transporter [unclassified Acidovorax]MCD2512582.1 MFS transporter [Acidovorax sp. D4N7]UYG53056.1 MFS transporter [Acidovorax sp. 5MLIR]